MVDNAERIEAVREALRAANEAGELARRSAPACHQCIYGPIRDTGGGWCEHPVFYRVRYDPMRGKLFGKHTRMNIIKARGENGLCGPAGLLFEGYRGWRRIPRWIATLFT